MLRLASWLQYVPYQNLCLGLGLIWAVLWVGMQVTHTLAGKPIGPREECRLRLTNWFQGQLESNASQMTRGLKSATARRRASTCTATFENNCLPRRTQVLFATAPAGSFAPSWTEATDADVGLLPEQLELTADSVKPYFPGRLPPTAVCLTRLAPGGEFDVWSVSLEDRLLPYGQRLLRGELLHLQDGEPPQTHEEWRW